MGGPPIPAIGAHWKDSPVQVPELKLKGNVPSHMLDVNDSWNASPSIEVFLKLNWGKADLSSLSNKQTICRALNSDLAILSDTSNPPPSTPNFFA